MMRRTVSASLATSWPEYGRASGVRSQNSGEDAHRRGLAGAVGTEQPENGALFDLKRDTIERTHVAAGKDLYEFVRLDGEGEVLLIPKKLSVKATVGGTM